jgi:outer membrane assembly lipoprotein YfiO
MVCKKLFQIHFFILALIALVLPACQQKKTIKTMNNQERAEAKNRFAAEKDTEAVIKTLELMLKESRDLNERQVVTLELADLLFDTKKFEKAGTMYKEFAKYYSGSEKAEYALYRAIVCAFNLIARADRDQTKTIEAIELAQNFLDRGAVFNTYAQEVEKILVSCQERLFESEMNVVGFYISRGRFVSAARRIDGVRKQFIPLLDTAEQSILMSECALAEKLSNPELLLAKQTELIQKFPESQSTVVAQNAATEKARSSVNRF